MKTNRSHDLKFSKSKYSGVTLYDIDTVILNQLENHILPNLTLKGSTISVPVLYASHERWSSIQKSGVYRDNNDQLQVPLLVFKRNTVERHDMLSSKNNRNISHPTVTHYSKKHKYDLFSKMTGSSRPVEQYNVTIPDFVNISYECVIWTEYTQHMNQLVESVQYASDEFWGEPGGFKFNVEVNSFDTSSEIGDGSKRIIKTNFSMNVIGYLLPEKFDNEPTTVKSLSPKKVVWDLTVESGVDVGINKPTPSNVNVTYPRYYGPSSDTYTDLPTSSDGIVSRTSVISDTGNSLELSINTNTRVYVIAVPNTHSLIRIFDTDVNRDISSSYDISKTITTFNDGNGGFSEYTVHILSLAMPYTTERIHKITIQ